jgi:hypothetical protein
MILMHQTDCVLCTAKVAIRKLQTSGLKNQHLNQIWNIIFPSSILKIQDLPMPAIVYDICLRVILCYKLKGHGFNSQ